MVGPEGEAYTLILLHNSKVSQCDILAMFHVERLTKKPC